MTSRRPDTTLEEANALELHRTLQRLVDAVPDTVSSQEST